MKRIKEFYFLITCLITCMFFSVFPVGMTSVKAASEIYTDVLDDLHKDVAFDEKNYPLNESDYSVQLIDLAESAENELFIYAYQPSGKSKDYRASSINISTTIGDEISYRNYRLMYCNSRDALYKYKVDRLSVSDKAVRYYAISSIYRPFDTSREDQASGGNKVIEVPYAVNRQYEFGTSSGQPYKRCVDIETIVVTDKFVGFVRYKDGFKLYVGACDSHFVAFNTDKPIDKLLEADVYYTTQNYSWTFATGVGERETFGDKEDKYAYLKYTDKVEHTGGGWFAGTYKWDRIQTVEDFISNENKDNVYSGAVIDVNYATKLTDTAMSELKEKKWVLRFAETDYTLSSYPTSTIEESTFVGNVTILRLKFETDGITYNLGVIDNKQSGSNDPSNETDTEITLTDKAERLLKIILGALLLIVLLVVLMPILPTIISFIINIVLLPFKAIAALFKAIFHKRK